MPAASSIRMSAPRTKGVVIAPRLPSTRTSSTSASVVRSSTAVNGTFTSPSVSPAGIVTL